MSIPRVPNQVERIFSLRSSTRTAASIRLLKQRRAGQFPQNATLISAQGLAAVVDLNLMAPGLDECRAPHSAGKARQAGGAYRQQRRPCGGMPQAAHTVRAGGRDLSVQDRGDGVGPPWVFRVNCLWPRPIATRGFECHSARGDGGRFNNVSTRCGGMGNVWALAEGVVYCRAEESGNFITARC